MVPWLLSSSGSQLKVIASKPWLPAGQVTLDAADVHREARRRGPDVGREIRMVVVHAGIHDSDDVGG
jgi:hypothetical protein